MKRHGWQLAIGLFVLKLGFFSGSAAGADATKPYRFLEPEPATYQMPAKPESDKGNRGRPGLKASSGSPSALTPSAEWVLAKAVQPEGVDVQIGRRIVLQVSPKQKSSLVRRAAREWGLEVASEIDSDILIFETAHPWRAARLAEKLAYESGVKASYPVMRRRKVLYGVYAPAPEDPFFDNQFYLENRKEDGKRDGAGLNARAAWPVSRGEGVTVAIADDGVEIDHPDLRSNTKEAVHRDFINDAGVTESPPDNGDHGTGVAGLVGAEGNNGLGISGTAPEVNLASWVIFGDDTLLGGSFLSEERLMEMFQSGLDEVAVQNHSWGNAGATLEGPSLLEERGLEAAFEGGRDGKGVVMIRAGGNNRKPTRFHPGSGNVNDDGFANDPNVIAVGAVREDGRVAGYSSPGACLLVSAPSGAEGFSKIVTTDLAGSAGRNMNVAGTNLANYTLGESGWSGTSFATPQISGLVALILSANSSLTIRDVQQILIHSSRHFDLDDPALVTNGAGFRVSDNVGFGVPDAGEAIRLATDWENRPEMTTVEVGSDTRKEITDAGLRVSVTGKEVPEAVTSIPALPSVGPHVDHPTERLPLVAVGNATEPIEQDLTGKAALIRRGENFFSEKINFAAEAGAEFVVIFNNRDEDQRIIMGGTDFVTLPAVFVSQEDGEALNELVEAGDRVEAQIRLTSTRYTLEVTEPLICEHVGVKVTADHPTRGNLRMTLVSPSGTRSVLQNLNQDETAGPRGWTYYSTQHFYESSQGRWQVAVSDEEMGAVGAIEEVTLTIRGVKITDSDADALDDNWERNHWGNLQFGPRDDPDADGFNNAREQVLASDPTEDNRPFRISLSPWKDGIVRLSWPGTSEANYKVHGSRRVNGVNGEFSVQESLSGEFPVTEWFFKSDGDSQGFWRIREVN